MVLLGSRSRGAASVVSLAVIAWACSPALAASASEGTVERAACDDRIASRRAYFGDLHVHTVFSLDASTMGTRNRPADAYRFAQGEALGVQPYDASGKPMRVLRLARPLDFAAVTDHAELFGERSICDSADLPGRDSMMCEVYRRWPRVAFYWMNFQASRAVRHDFCGPGGIHCREAARSPWRETVEAAEAAYDRTSACAFTTFSGYEWTGGAGVGRNFHRNVIFANDVVPEFPVSFIDAPDLREMWSRLESDCLGAGAGCDAVVIPHNSNLSGGEMFRVRDEDGRPIDVDEAEARARIEVLAEVMQHKGESECHLGLDTEDEFCGFEKLAENSFGGRFLPGFSEPPVARQFLRNVLKEGLEQEGRLGVNPFKFGFIASTDTHLATPGLVDEDSAFPGHGGAGKSAGERLPVGLPDHVDFNPGGLAVLWAEENTRASLFAAMRRREAYATSGPRIELRFFGGWDYDESMCTGQFAERGYEGGVAMGSDLPASPTASAEITSPVFAVAALRDPGAPSDPSTPLQRIQIVKAWIDGGETHEQVYDVAGDVSGAASVDPNTCETRGRGADRLCSVWSDPGFDPTQAAFYYARVLENPVCRWSQAICVSSQVDCSGTVPSGFESCCDEQVPKTVQERAWSSPIWLAPSL